MVVGYLAAVQVGCSRIYGTTDDVGVLDDRACPDVHLRSHNHHYVHHNGEALQASATSIRHKHGPRTYIQMSAGLPVFRKLVIQAQML